MRPASARLALATFLVLAPAAAARAHAPLAGAGGFHAGLLHPLSALDHLVPLLALGLLAGQQPGERGYRAAFACALAAAGGGWLALLAPAIWSGPILAAATLAAGALVAAARALPVLLVEALAVVLGLALGHRNALELPPDAAQAPFVLGCAAAVLGFLVYACGAVRSLRPAWARLGLRIAGSWLAAVGALILGLAFRG